MDNTINKGQKVSYWESVKVGFPLLCLLMGDFISFSKPSESGSGMFIDFETYRLVVFGGIYLLSAWAIYLRRVDFYSMMNGHWPYVFFLIYAFSSSLWAAYPAKALIISGHLLGHYIIAVAWLLMFRGYEVSLLRAFCMFSYVFIPACLITAVFFPDRNIHVLTNRWMGLTWNPNSLGGAVMICVWANISYLLYAEKTQMRLLIILMVAGSFILLVGAGSVTSMALSAIVVAGVPLLYWFARSRNAINASLKIAYSGAIIFGIFGYFYATQPELFEANRVLGSVGRDSNLTGRASLWAIANAAIDERPWLGWSFDALQSLPSKYSIRYYHFHNGYLDLMVRGGRIALGFIVFFAVTSAIRLVRIAPFNPRLFASYGVLLAIILLQNVSESTFGTAPNQLWLLFTFLYIGVSPRIYRWYETGVLETKIKQSDKLAEGASFAPVISPRRPLGSIQKSGPNA
ncbi:MAG: O-antigen ligase family protein [Burkholderiales bacterium]